MPKGEHFKLVIGARRHAERHHQRPTAPTTSRCCPRTSSPLGAVARGRPHEVARHQRRELREPAQGRAGRVPHARLERRPTRRAQIRLEELVFQGYWPYEHDTIGSMEDLDDAQARVGAGLPRAATTRRTTRCSPSPATSTPTRPCRSCTGTSTIAKKPRSRPRTSRAPLPEQTSQRTAVLEGHARQDAGLLLRLGHPAEPRARPLRARARLGDLWPTARARACTSCSCATRALAQEVSGWTDDRRGPDMLRPPGQARGEGRACADVEKAIEAEVKALAKRGPTDAEMAKVRKPNRGGLPLGLQSNCSRARGSPNTSSSRRRAPLQRRAAPTTSPSPRTTSSASWPSTSGPRAARSSKCDRPAWSTRRREAPRPPARARAAAKARPTRQGQPKRARGRSARRAKAASTSRDKHKKEGMMSFIASDALALVALRRPASPARPHRQPRPIRPTCPVPDSQENGASSRRAKRPPSRARRASHRFPKVDHRRAAERARARRRPARTLPIVQIRVLVKSGNAADGELHRPRQHDRASMLKDGGAGRYLQQGAAGQDRDAGRRFSGSKSGPTAPSSRSRSPSAHLDEAIDLLGAVVREPRCDEQEFGKLKKRQVQKLADKAKRAARGRRPCSSAASSTACRRALTRTPRTTPMPERARADHGRDCREFLPEELHRPRTPSSSSAATSTPRPPKSRSSARSAPGRAATRAGDSFAEATAPERLKIILVDRPKSSQSDIYVGYLGPERNDKSGPRSRWPTRSSAAASRAGSSSTCARSNRSPTTRARRSASSRTARSRSPPTPARRPPRPASPCKALLDNLKRIATEPRRAATRSTPRAATSPTSSRSAWRPSARWPTWWSRSTCSGCPTTTTTPTAKRFATSTRRRGAQGIAEHVREGHAVIAVAGDAERIGPVLSHFGDVVVFNPEKEFERIRIDSGEPVGSHRARSRIRSVSAPPTFGHLAVNVTILTRHRHVHQGDRVCGVAHRDARRSARAKRPTSHGGLIRGTIR